MPTWQAPISFLGFFGAMPPQQAWGKVKEAGLLAVAKDDRLPEGHGALALAKLHYDWDFAGAEQEFKRAVEIEPKDSPISTFLFAGLGQAYALAGMKSDAEQVLRTLLEKSKQSYVSPFDIALIYAALESLTKPVHLLTSQDSGSTIRQVKLPLERAIPARRGV